MGSESPGRSENVFVEQEGQPGSVILFDLRTLTRFCADGPFVQILSDVGTMCLVLFAFKAGQQLKEHWTSSQALVQVLRGQALVKTPGNSNRLQAGMVLQLEERVLHSVQAITDAVMLVTMTPSPAYHSWPEIFAGQTPLVQRSEDQAS